MPRTKIAKSSKRNRETSNREEKIRQFDSALDKFVNDVEYRAATAISEIDTMISMLLLSTNSSLLQMKFSDFMELNLKKLSDWSENLLCTTLPSANSMSASSKVLNPNDEGYLTEDSSNGACSSSNLISIASMPHRKLSSQQLQKLRTPGPLNSARARSRRSRSACGGYVAAASALKPKPTAQAGNPPQSERPGRSKLRTPSTTRGKAMSADRTTRAVSPSSPPTALMRWPKAGEMVLSARGSPLVGHMPDKFANMNIPMKNGVLLMRPKKMSDIRPDLIENLEPEVLQQIKTLHDNLNMIVNMATKNISKI